LDVGQPVHFLCTKRASLAGGIGLQRNRDCVAG
jgi:hypothetical protein